MRLRRLLPLLVLALFASAANAGTQRALLIGISEYEANLPPLAGATNDVLLFRELLVQKYGFDRSNIRLLTNQDATRAGILAALRALSETAGPDDIVFIHYSGHGSQAPDTNGDEPDGQDETILPHDSRMPGIADITDDELNQIIGTFRSESIVVILDSCHSGTGTRSGPARVTQRWVAPDTRRDLYESVTTRQVLTLPISENHVFFAAAQETESELDGPFGPDNMRLGLFTAAMVGVLANSPPNITPRQAIAGVGARIEALKASAAGMPLPEPNMEAPLEKQQRAMLVSNTTTSPIAFTAPAVSYTSGNKPAFAATHSIYATTNGKPNPGLAGDIARSVGDDIAVAASLEKADGVVDRIGRDSFDIYGPAGVVRVASGLSRNQAATASSSPPDYRFLADVIRNAPTLADLMSLENPAPGLRLQMKAAGVPEVSSRAASTRTVKVSVNTKNHRLQYYQSGAPRTRSNSLQLEVRADSDCYLTIASLNSKGEVYLLLPNAGQELSGFLSQGRVSGGTTVLIPDSLADDNQAGFHFDYVPPGGIDRIIGVCFTRRDHAERFRGQIAKLELGGTLDADLFRVGTRGATNITPSLTTSEPASASPPPAASQAVPAVAATATDAWTTAKLSLTVGND